VEGLTRLLFSGYNEPVNLGNPTEMTLLELAKLILELTKSKSQLKFEPLPQDDPRVRKPDIGRAVKLLKWKPKVDVKTGLKQTIKYFSSLIKI
jgi:nucleoside-diphosphate-sugar epimerase